MATVIKVISLGSSEVTVPQESCKYEANKMVTVSIGNDVILAIAKEIREQAIRYGGST